MMPLELRDRVNSGFLAGLMNSATYIGSTASAYGLGRIRGKQDTLEEERALHE